jgi:kanamycin kinase
MPTEHVEPPEIVRRMAIGATSRLAWRNELGGLTYEVEGRQGHVFVKWAPRGSGVDLTAEAERMTWARAFTPVPRPVGQGADTEGSWLVTEAVPGQSAVLDCWKAEPERAVTAIGEGLRALHEALPVAECPFSWSAEERLAVVRARASAGQIDRRGWHQDFEDLSVDQALNVVSEIPPVDRLVVCHGDACCPNTLLGPDGLWVAHVDLGQLGTADRWADLAVATWSTAWNYGPGWEPLLLHAYGAEVDLERIRYYRLLWDLGP